ncbi:ATPase component of ABC-type sugar transporter [Thioflavicoccus mobilis 8321]|uniref:ATPase component of ABC-type sugar transporter n=1 Tax=Thioflavicoccus mobilis 8321 TaxID=765912 RepID=L0H361_9GAMM|nr:sn-glycerol-3-phosphate ABC transporter ATP-binding protein UgpC [Thioflavicoccus mobilis]AGA92095.1 ATPase component of ABC-type sugar transporter [Thioflavicoccus mobilis 8321]
MAEIVCEGIAKRFADGTQALQPTDLTIRDGEFFVLVGPSGCGKSTLLKIIVGLERPSAGEVRVAGEAVTGRDPKDRNMAMVFQSYAIYPHMTVRENMAFPLKLGRLPEAEIATRVEEAAAILELTELLGRKPAALSGGQRQRVAMGRAIVRQPAAFLLDEPLSNLDAKLRVQMRTELGRLQRRLGTTTVYVTHDQTEALTLGERIAVLRRGAVQQVGTPRELYQSPANLFVAGFIGSPAMNLLPATLEGDRLRLPMLELVLPEPAPGVPAAREVIAGIRPEDFRVAPGDGDATSFRADVELVEWLGADLFVYFDVAALRSARLGVLEEELGLPAEHDGRLRLVARLGSDCRVREGAGVALGIEAGAILLFDPDSGERIDIG